MKKCSYCAEEIQEEATKCKHCGEKIKNKIESKQEKIFVFQYRAKDKNAQDVSGEIEAIDQEDALDKLHVQEGLCVISIKQSQSEGRNLNSVLEKKDVNDSFQNESIKKCPFCAEKIQKEAIKCKHCGEMIWKKCPFCIESIPAESIKCEFCESDIPAIIEANSTSQNSMKNQKNPAIACILSFFLPGLGQIYNGQIGKGVIFFILFVVLFGTIIIPIVIWLIALFDAHSNATIKS